MLGWDRKRLDFNAGKTLLVMFDFISGAIEMRICFSSKLDWGCYIISIAITASKKSGVLIHEFSFF